MVTQASPDLDPAELDLAHLALFVGLAVNQRVIERLEALGYRALTQSHGYLVQHLVNGPRSIGELAARLGITQQAVSKSVRELEALGYLKTRPSVEDARVRLVALSARGKGCVEAARTLRRTLERGFQRKHGKAELAEAKRLLIGVLDQLGGLEAIKRRRVRPPA